MAELEIELTDGSFDQSFLQFNMQMKKYMQRVLLDLNLNGECKTLLA